ncbi:MAG: SpoIID/LytB domain-containing protein [Chloroflexi bacterium]|nr:SpoIID/LytB domain-containing protein [Chloroflexota bacterium]
MDLASYPRPATDTGIGFHWFPDTQHDDRAWLKRFGPTLKTLGASWLTLPSGVSNPVPEHFIAGLQDRAIEPVVHLWTPFVAPVAEADLARAARHLANAGVRYVFIYDRPNQMGQWTKWPADSAPEAFMDLALPALETLAREEPLIPLLSPLQPGGDYHDLRFLDRCLEILAAKASANLKDKLGIAIHNFTSNKPLTWGHGASQAWPATRPGICPEGSEDHTGYCLHEWYHEIALRRLGRAALMVAAANGPILGDRAHVAHPPVDAARHAAYAAEMARSIMAGESPYYLANTAFWLLVAEDGDPFAAHRWYKPDGTPVLRETIQALADLPKRARTVPSVPATVSVLLEDGSTVTMELEDYVKGCVPRELPASSPMEALKAQAIAARTFAARAVQQPRHGATAVCTTSHCQNWSPKHSARSDKAVDETRGIVLTFGDELIGAYYFAHCDGHTRNSEEVWRAALPYCRSVPCICGNVKMYGHGVGMCQEGAIRMAQQGALAHEILTHYYRSVRVQRADGTPFTE